MGTFSQAPPAVAGGHLVRKMPAAELVEAVPETPAEVADVKAPLHALGAIRVPQVKLDFGVDLVLQCDYVVLILAYDLPARRTLVDRRGVGHLGAWCQCSYEETRKAASEIAAERMPASPIRRVEYADSRTPRGTPRTTLALRRS